MYNRISNRQMVYMLFMTLTTYNITRLPYIMAREAGRGSWIPILVASLFFGLIFILIAGLGSMFPGRTLIEYGVDIIGKIPTFLVGIYYFLYFTLIFALLHAEIYGLIHTDFLTETPQWAMSIVGIAVFGYIAYKGVTNLARLLEILAPLFIVFSVVLYTTALFQGQRFNILPLFSADRIPDYVRAMTKTIVPFLGVEILLFIPFSERNRKPGRLVFLTVLSIGLYYVLVVESCFKLVGINTIMHYETAVVEALRLVKFPVIERVDMLYLTVGFSGLFLGISTVYLIAVEIVSRLFPKAARALVTAAVGAAYFILCNLMDLLSDANKLLERVIPVTGIFSAVLLPAALLIAAKVKKRAKKIG